MADPAPRRRFLALDRLFTAYLLATGLLAAVAGGRLGALLAVVHVGGAAAVFRLTSTALPERSGWRFLRAVYPLALTPLLYVELAALNDFVSPGYFDATVQRWESAVFGLQLSMEAARWWPAVWVSEFFHVGYFSYYFLVPLAAVAAFRRGGAGSAHRVAFAACLAFFFSYLVFCFFPVAGPRYVFPPIGGAAAEGSFYRLVHALLESGSSRGTAFPSSHVAATTAAVLGTRRVSRRWFWVLLLPLLALTAGTVYGRFHYGVDATAGLLVGIAAHSTAPGLLRRLGEWP
ncbi:MAG: phosphatase PAP2 family protein [Gemmatimonadota bacterium]